MPDTCKMTCNLADLSSEMGKMSLYQRRWTSLDGDAIEHHYLFTASSQELSDFVLQRFKMILPKGFCFNVRPGRFRASGNWLLLQL